MLLPVLVSTLLDPGVMNTLKLFLSASVMFTQAISGGRVRPGVRSESNTVLLVGDINS